MMKGIGIRNRKIGNSFMGAPYFKLLNTVLFNEGGHVSLQFISFVLPVFLPIVTPLHGYHLDHFEAVISC